MNLGFVPNYYLDFYFVCVSGKFTMINGHILNKQGLYFVSHIVLDALVMTNILDPRHAFGGKIVG